MNTSDITAALDAANIRHTPEAVAMLAECNDPYLDAVTAYMETIASAKDRLIAAHPHMPETKAMQARIAELEQTAVDLAEHLYGSAPDPDGWIDWHGGAMPVAGGVEVVASYREGTCSRAQLAHAFNWAHDNGGLDIIAYRVLP